ncbi:hypothetical protein BVRB_7g164690 isoform A [Beta vulgaris subsp. vulgaris]|uniref:uncharacterized protein LOC104899077 isoform X2 n=1 Tax=Beta vulgaris subsp. vulgaris TaxID=3555 RepID=UPI00053F836A|nr:uncharacterized protein LOC104899077 isoform X2 [Beta vulgaris subsp. vulgaris]KMT05981.1 hypothetical protein BVRB_7g164690 isoform A [Beta vulgaris subsp. vulgaris]
MAHPLHVNLFGGEVDDVNVVDTETLDNIMDNILHDTDVVDDPDFGENSKTELLNGYDTEIVPDSDDDMKDAYDSKGFSLRSRSFVQRFAAASSDVISQYQPPCRVLDYSNLNADGGYLGGLATVLSVFPRNQVSSSNFQNDMQAAELHIQDRKISDVKEPCLADFACCDVGCVDSMKLSEGSEIDEDVKSIQRKTREVSIVYTRKKKRCHDSENKEVQILEKLNDDLNDSGGLSYVGSQEPEDLSDALLFVDQYVYGNAIAMPPTPTTAVIMNEISPPVLSAKGVQNMARLAKIRNSKVKTGFFEWNGSEGGSESVASGNKVDLSFKGNRYGQTYVRRSPSVRSLVLKELRSPGVLLTETAGTRESSNSKRELNVLTFLDTKLAVYELKKDKMAKQSYEEKDSKECNKLLDQLANREAIELEAGAGDQEQEDVCDVGTGTQIAAEAIQALSYSVFADYSEVNSNKCPNRMLDDPLGGNQKNVNSCIWSFPKKARSVARGSAGWPKCSRKNSWHYKDNMQASKLKLRRNWVQLASSECMNERSFKDHMKINFAKRRKLHDAKEAEVDGFKENIDAPIMAADIPLCNLKYRRMRTNIFPSPGSLKSSSLYNINDHIVSNSMDEKGAALKARPRRQGRGSIDNMLNVSAQKRNQSKLFYGKSCKTRKLLGEENKGDRTGNTSLAKMDPIQKGPYTKGKFGCTRSDMLEVSQSGSWYLTNYPRDKRTCRTRLDNSDGSSHLGNSVPRACMEERNHYPLTSHLNSESCFSDATKNGASLEQLSESAVNLQLNRKYNIGSVPVADSATHKSNYNMHSLDADCRTSTDDIPINMYDDHHDQNYKKRRPTSALSRELARLGFRDSMPEFNSEYLRQRKTLADMCVLLSHNLDESTRKQQLKILMRLGVPLAYSASYATHFVTDKFARTRNILEFIAQGKPVVTHLWLESCDRAGSYISDTNYILRDLKREKELGFTLPTSLDRARQCPLLKGYRVFITQNAKPGKEILACLVKAVHGQVLDVDLDSVSKDDIIMDDMMILSCEEDEAYCRLLLEKGAPVYSSEILLNGIIIQKLEFERHQLFTNHVKRHKYDAS